MDCPPLPLSAQSCRLPQHESCRRGSHDLRRRSLVKLPLPSRRPCIFEDSLSLRGVPPTPSQRQSPMDDWFRQGQLRKRADRLTAKRRPITPKGPFVRCCDVFGRPPRREDSPGLPELQRSHELTRQIYGQHSETAHHRRKWTQDAVAPRLRTMIRGRSRVWARRAVGGGGDARGR